ncbi:M18 family aminopeptidase [Dysosmobacter sp.]
MEQSISRQLLDFLSASPSCYHAVANLEGRLLEEGYEQLLEFQPWKLTPGGRYFVVRGDSTLAAFRVPQTACRGFMLAAAHSDSPTFKVRQQAEVPSAGGCVRLSVEPYGGMISRSWMDRPLSVAGRVVVRQGTRLETRLVNIDRDLLVIPSVAIHLDREVNKGTPLRADQDLLPLLGCAGPGAFRTLLAEAAAAAEEDLISTELFLYPRTPGTLLGASEELIASPRLDDLQCVFGCFRGFLQAEDSASVPLFCVFNNEEVGSATRQGADSTFLTDVLGRISAAAGAELPVLAANSFFVSADNAHAVHPSHPEYADCGERPVLNGGIVLKYSAGQKYTTDAVSAAVFQEICRLAQVPVQRYSNRADLPGGSTLGNISSAHFSVPSVDIGLAQLAMHAAYEVAGARDTEALVRAMTVYFGRSFCRLPDGGIQW